MKIGILISAIIFAPFLVFSQSCLPEGIEFYSQAQIDSFSSDYPGCTVIEGNVVISSGYDITNLDGLNGLTSIGGNLKIYNNYALVNLTGLEGLTSIGSDLWIYSNSTLFSLSGLDNLESIGGLLQIVYNPGLQDITDIQSLDAASMTDLTITDNPCLTDCNAQSLCDYLAAPNGVVIIYNNASGCSNPPDIAESCGMQMPCLPFGNYYFTTQADIDSFSVDYPGCSHLNSFVQISGDIISNLSGLSVIICIDGSLSVSDNSSLYNLEGLDNLDSITEHLYISHNESLQSLSGLDSLSYLGGSLVAGFNTALSSLDGLQGLDTVRGNVEIHDNESLTSVNGLNNVEAIKCHLLIENNPELQNLDGLENLHSVNLRFILGGNNSLNNISGLSNLAYLGDELWIGYNDDLYNLNSLESLDSIGGNLVITSNISLVNLSGLDSIFSVGGYLEISDNDDLASLQALHNLSSINGSMMIYMNDGLSSLSGIDNIHAGTITGLWIDNNSLLSTCEVNSVCSYLSNPNGTTTIENNAEGCDSPGEVQEACFEGVGELAVGSRQLTVIVYPNPTRNMVDFRWAMGDFQRVTLKIFDNYGREIAMLMDEKLASGQHDFQFNTSWLSTGLYFYYLSCGDKAAGGKLAVIH
jgi:hypothetical protein